ncbi:PREDICTED: protein SUPPRESSOR OF npr1-1, CONSTITUTIVE 1-like isoform X6 [Populus euphratica]|uniref:ADP-ribosyl cyclase/cyclic ADP-ribose hydrolase n=1 Tax=Populus euphratica TaxID=75702 RepID=A0AAJ6T2A1_POPEU|nr:PREDICTED: protein SUPPRESSOR OF npr1-1, CONSTITUTIVE 1-like isoform X6 [Populus euphratica]
MAMFFLFLSIFLFVYIWRFIIRSRHVSPSPSTPSTLTTAQPQVIKYDVFLSFRGVDTRSDFTSHLYAALNRKQILTFIDYQLVRGDEISASLLRTIEEAKLSVIVFSENYASSKWCLEELAKIFERRKNNGQIVIPVFYQVDPSHVRNQTGRFGDAFARLIKKKALTMDKEQSFRDALTDAANLSGWSLGKSELESEFIEKIVGDVLNKLHAMSSSHTTGLFGIDARIHKVESLLNMESQDVLIVGIWGMGGIGKTTIAEAVCNKVRSRFEGIFVANFRQELKARPMADLQRSFLSQLLGQEILKMGSLSFRDSFVRDRLRRKMVFIVLDDVDDLMALEEWKELLHGRHSSFGRGSKVLITSRDRQVLSNIVDETYKVERLNYEEALQLFSSKALKNCIPTIDHRDLIKRIASHVQGNPLALIVLGSSLYGKSPEEWYSALNKLAQNPRIENALRISYNGLDQEQQSIFLDIAHFFRKFEQNQATRILDGFYGRPVIFDISMLINKGLITTSRNMLEIHDLLQEMAFNIVRAESKFPGKRSRLCHLTDIVHVLEENKGAEEIEGISLDMSRLSRQIQLKSDAFAMMDGLRFIKFFFGHLSQDNKDKMQLPPTGLEYLSNKLRYLHWDGFPSKSLPHVFCAEHLVELNLSRSKVEKLWTGVQDVGNLRKFVLSYSPYLMELPDLSKARNLVSLHLVDCPSLTEVPLSLQYLDKLEELDLNFCYNLRSFPMLDSKVLKVLSISRCLDVTKCPTISQNMKSLYLEETSIKEVPQSITSKLENLGLHGCSKITKFPEISGDVKTLYLSGTAIKEVPSSIQFLTRLRVLDMSGCSKLESFPEITVPMKSLVDLNLSKTGIKEIPSSLKHMISLRSLGLDGTPIEELPLSIKDMVCLRYLALHGTHIKALPELPPSLRSLTTHDCASLETMILKINIGRLWDGLNFANCFKLDQKPLIAAMHLKIQSGEEIPHGIIQMVLPGSEIPEWFGDKGIGSSVTIQLPSNCHQLKGIAFCLVFLFPLSSCDFDDRSYVRVYVHVKSKNGEHDGDDEVVFASKKGHALSSDLKTWDSDHMVLLYDLLLVNDLRKNSGNEVTFKFYHEEVNYKELERGHTIQRWIQRPNVESKSCGVYLHFDENPPADKGYKRKFW